MDDVGHAIKGFSGDHRFLSNFWPAKVTYRGAIYPTVEHAYQAAKTRSLRQREAIRRAKTPSDAKRLGKSVTLRDDWETYKEKVMAKLLQRKFKHLDLRQKLLATGDTYLEETNWWNDTYWGVCRGKGENRLGHLLMELRTSLK